MNYLFDILLRIALYTLIGFGANILVFNCGFLILNIGATVGLAAYITAILMTKLSIDFTLILMISMASSMLISFLLFRPILNLQGDRFSIASLGIQMVIISILNNLDGLTNGAKGLKIKTFASVWSWNINTKFELLPITLVLCLATYYFILWIQSIPYGRALQGIRDEVFTAKSLGKNPVYFNSLAIMISAGLLGLGGSLYCIYSRYLDPTAFGLDYSIKVLSIIILGGLGNVKNIFSGAIIIVIIPELIRVAGFSKADATALENVLFGIILLVILIGRPIKLNEILTQKQQL